MDVLDDHKVVLLRLLGRRFLGPLKENIGIIQGGDGQNAAHQNLCHRSAARWYETKIGAALVDLCLVEQGVAAIPFPFSFLKDKTQLLNSRDHEGRQLDRRILQIFRDGIQVLFAVVNVLIDGIRKRSIFRRRRERVIDGYIWKVGRKSSVPLTTIDGLSALVEGQDNREGKDMKDGHLPFSWKEEGVFYRGAPAWRSRKGGKISILRRKDGQAGGGCVTGIWELYGLNVSTRSRR